MPEAAETTGQFLSDTWRSCKRLLLIFGCVLLALPQFFFLLCFGLIGVAPMPPGNIGSPTGNWLAATSRIGQAMVRYANDHDGNYPDGASSTEVFQKLLDGRYCDASTIFYLPLEGKTAPIAGARLKPENVCFDVTSGVDSSAPDWLPLVFMTGYKLTYAPGASAVPVGNSYPRYKTTRTWEQFYYHLSRRNGMAVYYKANSVAFFELGKSLAGFSGEGAVFPYIRGGETTYVIPPSFNANGRVFRQLTPGGSLP